MKSSSMLHLGVTFLLFIALFNGCQSQQNSDNSKNIVALEDVKSKIGKEAMVLEIGSKSCTTCIKMKKTIDAMKEKNPTLPIYIIDVYDDMSVFSFFKLQVIPTQIVLNKKGEEVYRHMGGLSANELQKLVELAKKE